MRSTDVDKLKQMVGRPVRYGGRSLRILDVIDDPPMLVLADGAETRRIQGNAMGEAHRRVPATIEIPLSDPDTGEPDPRLSDILIGSAREPGRQP